MEDLKRRPERAERLRALVADEGPAGRFAWKALARTLAYAARRVGEITDDIAAIDEAMRWGFLFAMGAAIAVYVLTMAETVTGREAVHIIMTFGLAAALIRWGILERRAYQDG